VQIQQVLINLVTNALEALRTAGRGPRRVAIRSVPLDEHNVLLEVSDTGAGITPEEMTHIFQAFFTTKATAPASACRCAARSSRNTAGACGPRRANSMGRPFICGCPERCVGADMTTRLRAGASGAA
jgi:hypothetical protein